MQPSLKLPRSLEPYLPIGSIVGLLLILYAPLLLHWVDGWVNKSISTEHEYYSHGLLGLPFAAYLCWSNRDRWRAIPDRSHWAGIVLLVLGVAFYQSGLSDLVNLSLCIVLAGICLWLKGVEGLRLQAFPLLLVFLASPTEVPYLIAPLTLPLQSFIAGMAGFILLQAGMEVRVDQIYLFVNDRIVEVAPYCAGLKMLFTSLYVGLMLVYWTGAWTSRQKTTLFFTGIVVVSVVANIVRNTLLTYFHGTSQEGLFHWLHDGWGGDAYSACMLGTLILLLKGLDRFLPDQSPQLENS